VDVDHGRLERRMQDWLWLAGLDHYVVRPQSVTALPLVFTLVRAGANPRDGHRLPFLDHLPASPSLLLGRLAKQLEADVLVKRDQLGQEVLNAARLDLNLAMQGVITLALDRDNVASRWPLELERRLARHQDAIDEHLRIARKRLDDDLSVP